MWRISHNITREKVTCFYCQFKQHTKKKQLSKYKSNLRGLVKKDTVTNKKKIAQRGGFLKTLVSIAIPLIIKSISTLNAKSNARRKKRILAMKKRY